MDFTVEISNKYNVLPFEIMKQDKDSVIMLINYFCEKGADGATRERANTKYDSNTVKRIRVNDKTASGGWF